MTQDKINLIVDTDIGPDCDDAGALTLLHILACKKKKIHFLAMTNCTSNPYACGTIDAINRYYRQNDIPVGGFEKKGFLEDGTSQKYNRYITENYDNRYKPPASSAGALGVLKDALSVSEDASVTILTIGPLNNMAALVKDEEGFVLIQKKVIQLVSMATAQNPDKIEWNVKMDIPAAATVCECWPTPVVFSPMETGSPIITGKNFGSLRQEHPLRIAYRLFNNGDETHGRPSWDLTAAWFAVMGTKPFFELSEPYDVSVLNNGHIIKTENNNGKFRFLQNKIAPEEIAIQIDSMWSE
jgi:inosine-uridine nucleoside N-ribohydrolase